MPGLASQDLEDNTLSIFQSIIKAEKTFIFRGSSQRGDVKSSISHLTNLKFISKNLQLQSYKLLTFSSFKTRLKKVSISDSISSWRSQKKLYTIGCRKFHDYFHHGKVYFLNLRIGSFLLQMRWPWQKWSHKLSRTFAISLPKWRKVLCCNPSLIVLTDCLCLSVR